MKKHYYIWLNSLLLISACVKDKPDPDTGDPVIPHGESVVYIANEGSLYNGNSSLSLFNIESGEVFNDIYTLKNSQPLGDIFQSITAIDNQLFLAVNNSDKIVVIDKTEFNLVTTIPVAKPRYMLKVTEEKMYVSSLYHPQINIVNPQTYQITGKIELAYLNSEGMALLNGKVYACTWDTACRYLYEIDAISDQVTDSIPLAGAAPQQVMVDRNKKLWVLGGNVHKQKNASLTQIDPESKTIIRQFIFPEGADIMKPAWNPRKDTLYYLGVNYNGDPKYNGVYRMSIGSQVLPEQLFIPAQPLQYYWALGVDSVSNQIYLGDPKGFVQKGNISIYDAEGTKMKSFDVGLGPGYFYFDR